MKKMKDILCSENGMKIVNALFLLSMVFYKSGLLFIAYIVWIVYLVFCVKHADSKGSKIIYSVFIGIAAIMICLNLWQHRANATIRIIQQVPNKNCG